MSSEFDTRERADARSEPYAFDGKRWLYRQTAPTDRIRFMARHSGYVMVRKPGAMPFVLTEKEWLGLALFPGRTAPAYRAKREDGLRKPTSKSNPPETT